MRRKSPLVSLKARILFGASLWTVGHFMIAAIFLYLGAESRFVMRVLHSSALSRGATAVIAALCMYTPDFGKVRRGISSI